MKGTTTLSVLLTMILSGAGYAQTDEPHAPLKAPMKPDTLKKYYVDLDRDGVVDVLDECPNTPKGVKVDLLGCEIDSDNDGVPDSKDMCPNSPAGTKVNLVGCVGDDDQDGVPNDRDACPHTILGKKVDAKGCAHDDVSSHAQAAPLEEAPLESKPLKEVEHGDAVTVSLHLRFPTGEYHLSAAQKQKIRDAFAKLKALEGDQVLLIEGHTDAIGCQDDNLKLSWNRAEAVRQFLVNERYLPASKIYIVGWGENKPVADNYDVAGRAQNRRVDMSVVSPDALPAEAVHEIPDDMRGYVRRPGRCPLPDSK
ncbi:OmpA-OmpF porin, OOP family [Sulfurivirga caldicuralii]|uniref:OmpA-OmpF porin, OOP family n=1 Tax=Sulfurivirga caldicuralii TaxID=364032 RepID=A0A1N6GF75_9GAMM|nr:OmpA family protein [Sulfurivirga caldicuralii]SIO06185.1 OmpA-OmpF porin, OOP family [Sulfurivirga caldicuralii]